MNSRPSHRFFLLWALLVALGQPACAPQLIGLSTGNGSQTGLTLAGLSYSGAIVVGIQGTAISTLTPSFASGAATSWSVSPAFPTGISINSSTGVVSGTPTTTSPGAGTSAFTNYTVTATNSAGSVTYTIKMLIMSAGIVVTSNAWTADGSPNDGICQGPCTLRGAFDTLNGTGSAAQTLIKLNPGTYTLGAGLGITKNTLTNVTICGDDAATTILDGASLYQIVSVYTGGSPLQLTFCNVTFRNGYTASNALGGAVDFEQSVDGGSLNLRNVVVRDTTSAAAGASTGTAIFVGNGGTPTNTALNVERSSFINNSSYTGGGAIAVYASGAKVITVDISKSYFASNSVASYNGGALTVDKGITTITQSTFTGNSGEQGGAIGFINNNTFTITNSTFFANTASVLGGAIDIPSSTTSGTIRLSSFVNNTSTPAASGGAISTTAPITGTVTIVGNLFSGNTANSVAHHCLDGSGISMTNNGYNAYSTAGGSCGPASGNDTSSTSVGVATSLALNGGEVLNLALQSGSAALGRVPAGTCSAIATVDTRDYTRSGACDAGAYEQ